MTTTTTEQLMRQGLCGKLSPQQADKIFFPGSGGKPTKAKQLCDQCPFEKQCLINAIEKGLSGFWAGTTEKERSVMAQKWHVKVQPITDQIEALRPSRVIRRVSSAVSDTLAYLDSLTGPSEEELKVK